MFSRRFLFVFVFFLPLAGTGFGCKSNQTPTNPFAYRQTVPPPATFSGQETYLGQSAVTLSPTVPATVFPGSSPATSQPVLIPSNTLPLSEPVPVVLPESTGVLGEGASRFQAGNTNSPVTDWTPATVAVTSQTAFQNLDTKTNAVSFQDSGVSKTGVDLQGDAVSSSQILTQIKEESPQVAPAQSQTLYSGRYE